MNILKGIVAFMSLFQELSAGYAIYKAPAEIHVDVFSLMLLVGTPIFSGVLLLTA